MRKFTGMADLPIIGKSGPLAGLRYTCSFAMIILYHKPTANATKFLFCCVRASGTVGQPGAPELLPSLPLCQGKSTGLPYAELPAIIAPEHVCPVLCKPERQIRSNCPRRKNKISPNCVGSSLIRRSWGFICLCGMDCK